MQSVQRLRCGFSLAWLIMNMRALPIGACPVSRSRCGTNSDIKSDGQSAGRIARAIVARLILKIAVYRVCSGGRIGRGNHSCGNWHVTGIHTQLFVGSKREGGHCTRRIFNPGDHNVAGQREVQHGWDQLRHGWLVGVDMEARFDPEQESHGSRMSGTDRYRAKRFKGDLLRPSRLLG